MTGERAPRPAAEDASAWPLAEAAAAWALEKKASDVVILDLRGLSDVCDFFVIAGGAVEAQVRAIAESVQDGLARRRQRPLHVEGLESTRWVLLDYVDVVVHVMVPAARDHYQLERLWGDAPRTEIAGDYFDAPSARARHPELPPIPAAAGRGRQVHDS